MNALTTTMRGALAPTTMSEAMRFAEMLANSTMVPGDYRGKPANVLVAMQWGAELGLAPMQALQNVAVINGRPSIWGDAALALVRGSGLCEGVKETIEGEGDGAVAICMLKRRGEDWERRTFSVADARMAGLWDKAGPWKQYPMRMLQLRARGFAVRDVFPDVLRGVITSEEARDIPTEPREVRGTVVEDVRPALSAPGPRWVMLSPDNREMTANNAAQWRQWCERAIDRMESGEALAAWRDAMAQHSEALHQHDPDAVAAVQAAIEARMDAFAAAEDAALSPAQGEG